MSATIATQTPTVRHVRASDSGSLEELLYDGNYRVARSVSPETRIGWFVDTLVHHTTSNPVYRRIAERHNFRPSQLLDSGDLSSVPLLPAAIFKRGKPIASASVGDVQITQSSGTSGARSVIPRDQRTLERFVGSVTFAVRDFLDLPTAREVLVLGPPTEEAGEIWFSYVLSLVGLLHETHFAVRNDTFDRASTFAHLASLHSDVQPLIVGPPSLLADFLEWCVCEGKTLQLAAGDRGAFAITAGGWKKRADEAIPADELRAHTEQVLGIPGAAIRDTYNAVELNTVLMACEFGALHVPPWLEVHARRSHDLSVCAPGEPGLLAFLDASATSYPAMYLSDDIGSVEGTAETQCACGRFGPVLQVDRRVQSGDQRGCGLSLNRYARQPESNA